ncbi:DASH complex subunit Duo1 [Ceraceosorus bombacis]|uniref:DASH complex subunit DUO1 n=1 Tax=Ceraceosorus bombacis TaxID=401625 RepID=A0A0P1BD63_9BASI|nr:DASH complex subunit Duo1 [Ceraceosorus bombacis]
MSTTANSSTRGADKSPSKPVAKSRQSLAPPGARRSVAPRSSAAPTKPSSAAPAAAARTARTAAGNRTANVASTSVDASSGQYDSPGIDARFADRLAELSVGDDSALMDFGGETDASPLVSLSSRSGAAGPRASFGKRGPRPSWGPKAFSHKDAAFAPAPVHSKQNMRFLEGIGADSSAAEESQVGGSKAPISGTSGRARARQSLFQKSSLFSSDGAATSTSGAAADADESFDFQGTQAELGLGQGDHGRGDGRASGQAKFTPRATTASGLPANDEPTQPGKAETQEQRRAQLDELRRMNEVFEGYEKMLRGTTDQVDDFSQRIAETDALLDMYIDLLRQADRTQRLLLDGDWKGATEDAAAHALSLELAERETARLRAAAQAEAAARSAAVERAQAEARARSAPAGTGTGRGGAAGGRGAVRGATAAARGARGAATGVRGRGASTGTRGASAASATSTAARGRGAAGPPATITRASGIARARPTSTGVPSRGTASGRGTARSSGYGQ